MGKGEPDTKSIQSTASQNTTSSLHSKKQGGFLTRMMSRRSKSRGSFDIETGVPPGHFRKGSASKAAGEYVSTSSKRGNVMECPLCLMERPKDQFPDIITCEHRSCQECLRQYLKIEITESRVNIACPECAEVFHPNDIKRILNDNMLMSKYEEFALRRVLMMDPDCRWCPAPDCGYAVIAAGCASCPEVACQRTGCNTSFCYHCKQIWHPNQTCDAARQQRSGRIRKSSLSCSQGSISHQVKPCPRCTALIIKMDDGSCNHMTCAVCGAEFCWLCMKEISDLHYLSPSGCTFWGKKPWSRKKKILWQLGTLVGAPVGIALIAGIAVPAMIIGIPVYVGRKVYWKYSNASKHRRNIAIFGSVSLSIVAAPVLAALTVGIGVPIMLTYVYGVVPFSLCRSGGCGVTTSHSGGVRIEFDNDNDVTVGVTNASDINPEVNSAVGNSSIGEASVARESQLEVVGILHDDTVSDSASTRAIAGSSLTGSLSGSGSVGPSVIGQNKLDVHIEVSSKRCSLSSESASLYLPDNSSMTAMAGSISEEKGVTNISSYVDGHAEMLDKITKSRHSSGGSSNVEISQHLPVSYTHLDVYKRHKYVTHHPDSVYTKGNANVNRFIKQVMTTSCWS
ncbi:E3 ubiquitin-protein ligase RNF19A-like [Anneissia japonica]|uniref:E3 ubiquitin-protein ligase RNF19A-like n=1 Tax=Anneissia japonica TaxID=1529436 RepID=UPI001425AFEF|nr:E3 ubiquitin-protein ligase RNF19A-like [Anneissia japonica]